MRGLDEEAAIAKYSNEVVQNKKNAVKGIPLQRNLYPKFRNKASNFQEIET